MSGVGADRTTGLSGLPIAPSYRTGRSDLIADFYRPCLSTAISYDRAVGYFRSSLYCLTGVALSDFALRGGRMRMICSPQLSPEDSGAIEGGLSLRDQIDSAIMAELRTVLETPENRPVVQLLATMIAFGALDLRIAYRPGARGIFHDKVGIFRDAAGTAVSFVGSSNETYQAWDEMGNHEVIEVFRSWMSDSEHDRVAGHEAYFDDLWSGREPDLNVRPFPDVPREELLKWQNPDGVEAAIQAVQATSKKVAEPPETYDSSRRQLLAHQVGAVEAWERGCRGIVKHATGAGKTLTAIEIIRRWIAPGRPAIVVVPSDLLLRQWVDELTTELADLSPTLIRAGAGASPDSWEPALPDMTRGSSGFGPRIIVSTLQTASSPGFLARVAQGKHLLIVSDEVHRAGSPSFSKLMTLEAGGRLGLSATPERYGDAAGTARVLDYFGPILEPEFGLADAIACRRLVPYDYFVELVALTEDEQERWLRLTSEIRTAYARLPRNDSGEVQLSEHVRQLLIKRARIVKKAADKPAVAARIVRENYHLGQSWLVYCDDQEQLREVVRRISEAGIDTVEYHSSMVGHRDVTMDHFAKRGGVLVAIRCLDEGVDLPSVSHALILASSANPREHIQRRGRVLRWAPGKAHAVVYDLLVTMRTSPGELSVIDGDATRAIRFAATARNEATRQYLTLLARQTRASEVPDFETDADD